MPITFEPMRRLMQTENISYYRLANEGHRRADAPAHKA